MRRVVLFSLAAALVLAPAAAAKGPHVVLTTPRETVEPGKPWEITVELNEFRHPPRPAMIGRRGTRTVGAQVDSVSSSIDGARAFKISMVFPSQGRWRLRLFAGNRRFGFPAVHVGGARMPQDYVSFPTRSGTPSGEAFTTDEAPADKTTGQARPPDGGGLGPWILPLLGVVLAGAGVAAVTRRGSR
jgi:hypothetical protein